jgi:hypothetical protein
MIVQVSHFSTLASLGYNPECTLLYRIHRDVNYRLSTKRRQYYISITLFLDGGII